MRPISDDVAQFLQYWGVVEQAAGLPGQWVVLSERCSESDAWRMAQALVIGRCVDAFEARSRGRDVYVRFVGG